MNRNSSRAWSKICGHGQCIAQIKCCSRIASKQQGWEKRVAVTLVREFESKEIRDVIRRIFVMQTKINCSIVLTSDSKFMRLDKAE
jgi:hypothetical protein